MLLETINNFVYVIYFIIILIVLSIIFKACIHIMFPFWSKQPVFYYYNLYYWLFPPGIIHHGKHEKNKFYNGFIEFFNYNNLKTEKKALLYSFLKVIILLIIKKL